MLKLKTIQFIASSAFTVYQAVVVYKDYKALKKTKNVTQNNHEQFNKTVENINTMMDDLRD